VVEGETLEQLREKLLLQKNEFKQLELSFTESRDIYLYFAFR
jgi:hypothetical protein